MDCQRYMQAALSFEAREGLRVTQWAWGRMSWYSKLPHEVVPSFLLVFADYRSASESLARVNSISELQGELVQLQAGQDDSAALGRRKLSFFRVTLCDNVGWNSRGELALDESDLRVLVGSAPFDSVVSFGQVRGPNFYRIIDLYIRTVFRRRESCERKGSQQKSYGLYALHCISLGVPGPLVWSESHYGD